MEINSEIRGHLPVWRQKLLNILEEVEQERKSKKRKIQVKTTQPCQSETRPSQSRNMIANEVSKESGYNAFSNNVCRGRLRVVENRKGSLRPTEAGHHANSATNGTTNTQSGDC